MPCSRFFWMDSRISFMIATTSTTGDSVIPSAPLRCRILPRGPRPLRLTRREVRRSVHAKRHPIDLRGGSLRSTKQMAILALSLLAPAAARAQGVTIDHQEIGCIVAGKYPKMNACFVPASKVKSARVYFRPETLTQWYYVKMTSEAPCFAGVLLRPSKALIDKKIFYYVDVQGEGSARTPEYAPIVVASEDDCRKKLPIAPLS